MPLGPGDVMSNPSKNASFSSRISALDNSLANSRTQIHKELWLDPETVIGLG